MLPLRHFSTLTIAAIVSAAAALAAIAEVTPSSISEGPSSEPIVFALNDWASQKLTSRIMGGVLREAGYNVEYKAADYKTQFP
ncbi:MAG: hypothetical protein PVI61_13735, partial [Methyloceanibacter sp.]